MLTARFSFLNLFLALAFLLTGSVWAKPHPGVAYVKTQSSGIPVHLVDVDLGREDLVVRPVIVPTGHRSDFSKMVRESRPVAAINGTFFDTKTGITVGNLVSKGRLLSEGMSGSNLVVYKDRSFALLSSARNLGRYQDWSGVDFAIGGGPTLLSDGQFFMDPSSEGFKDPGLFKPRPRSAVGVTPNGHLRMVVVTRDISLWELARVMKELNCLHAINLDGGSSTGLSVGGDTMVAPRRRLTNILGVYVSHMEPELNRAVEVAQGRALAHYQKGQALLQAGRSRLARSQLRQAVAMAPEQAGFWKASGLAEWSAGNLELSARDLFQASTLYFQRGDLAKALELCEKILEFDPDHVAAHLLCGECKLDLGLDAEADEHLRLVLDSQPGHPKATRLFEALNYRKKTFRGLKASSELIGQSLSYSFRTSTLPIE